MEKFTIKGEIDTISISFEEVFGFPDETSHWGGYDVRTTLEIKSGNFNVTSTLWTSTGEIFEFFEKLKLCNGELKGASHYHSYEGNLEISATYDNLGHVDIRGTFSEQSELDNRLYFNFITDQTFIRVTLDELQLIANKYGDMTGAKKTTNA